MGKTREGGKIEFNVGKRMGKAREGGKIIVKSGDTDGES